MRVIRFPIETARLTIRPLAGAEAELLWELWRDPANSRFSGECVPEDWADDARRFIDRGKPWGVWERVGGELVGDCTLFENEGEWELAYGFRRDRWGQGYATEAGAACLEVGFDELRVDRVVADVDPANSASIRVLEKLGFEPAGERYALTRC